ncbi:glucosaminidase domain-containing protein [Amphritea sp. HPY]|uniref:glucosaminidase domain-containing protein n=1 Tax=Amphritea sp. HPY TaxID=3421652 RepID=UPI003D7D0E3C
MRSTAQTAILLFAVAMFGIGALLQIAQQASEPVQPELSVIYQDINSPEDIRSLESDRVAAIAYTRVISLQALPVQAKKDKFIAMMLPAILIGKQRLQQTRQQIELLLQKTTLSDTEQAWLDQYMARYRADTPEQLPAKMIDMPNSIVLSQAAIETGWGTSRFFLEGNNIFGVWSVDAREPRIRASESRNGKAIYVKKYDSLLGAVDDYFMTLGRGGPYRSLRAARSNTDNPLQLIQHLGSYSELGDTYIKRLRNMIEYNDLQRFDNYTL